MRSALFALTVAAMFAIPANDASAAGRRGRGLWRPLVVRQHHAQNYQPTVRRYNRYDHYRELYPKYYGGFHSSFFHNYGVPSGDAGLRGNGIYPTPW